ncbi:Werner Syndrome-like exonuclease [Eutrema salsugineum]|nr:Werner Syndrome-like exonuclease [Eutrema salsugineum]
MAPTIRTIERYRGHQKYSVDFFGDDVVVTVTETPLVIRRWIQDVIFYHRRSRSRSRRPLLVGVGVYWTPAGYHSDSDDSPPASNYYPPAETLQLCVGKRCIIIQLSYCNRVPLALRRFLTNPQTTFVGVWNPQDARRLERSRHQLEIGRLLDVKDYVRDSAGRSLSRRSFEEIVEECMGYPGVTVVQEISMSDWGVDYLSLDQVLLASVDAYVSFKLGVRARLWQV